MKTYGVSLSQRHKKDARGCRAERDMHKVEGRRNVVVVSEARD